jgi:hypothetical protein
MTVAYFFFAIFMISQFQQDMIFGAEGNMLSSRYANIIGEDGGFLSLVKVLILNPALYAFESLTADKLTYALNMLLPLAFLPLITRKPSRWLLLGPFYVLNLVTDYQYQYDIGFQYSFGSGALLIYLAVLNLADLSSGQYVSVGKYNSAIAERDDFKSKYTATLTEAQRVEQENIERENRYKEIEKQNSVYRYTEKLSSTIADKVVLGEVAVLMAEGKFDEAIDKQNAYLATEKSEIEKRIKDELMKQNPQSQAQNDNGGAVTKEQFASMGVAERTKLYREQPELYNQLNEN